MSTFHPGEKVIKCDDKDATNWGTVMDIPFAHQKPGYIAVYFQRKVWIKPENVILLSEWKAQQPQQSIKDFWMRGQQ